MKKSFGFMPDGREVFMVELHSGKLSTRILTYGATIQSFCVPDKDGNIKDIVLGFDSLEDYIEQDKCFGCIVGRCTNRISNASFKLNGIEYKLYKNSQGNSSHGGKIGFSKKIWDIDNISENSVTLHLFSPDMEENYPGDLDIYVRYTLTEKSLRLEYNGHCNKDTIVNLTNHAYFNLEGHESGDISNHLISINADYFLRTDNKTVPDGTIVSVDGTPLDLRQLQPIGNNIDSDYDQIKWSKGFDRNWCINGKLGDFNKACELIGPNSKIKLEMYTTQPGLQLYTGNYLGSDRKAKDGVTYVDRGGYALEAQGYPDAINHPNFPSVVLKAGEEYKEKTEYFVDIEKCK